MNESEPVNTLVIAHKPGRKPLVAQTVWATNNPPKATTLTNVFFVMKVLGAQVG
ncbi:MAG: hypothetical protein ACYDEV_15910 [Acidiferrobacter sp.]